MTKLHESTIDLGFLSFGNLSLGGKTIVLWAMLGKSTCGRTAKSYHWRDYSYSDCQYWKRMWLPIRLSGISIEMGHCKIPILGWRIPFCIQLMF